MPFATLIDTSTETPLATYEVAVGRATGGRDGSPVIEEVGHCVERMYGGPEAPRPTHVRWVWHDAQDVPAHATQRTVTDPASRAVLDDMWVADRDAD